MTNEQASLLAQQIEDLKASERRQVMVEFEGQYPDFDLPQVAQRIDVIAEINNSGTHAYMYEYGLITREDFDTSRERWNGLVTQWVADHPGQQVPSIVVKGFVDEVGLTLSAIQGYKKVFGL